MANDFPILSDEAVYFNTDATVDHDLPQESSWQPSKELKNSYDYSGGLVPRPAEYVAPRHYEQAGRTFYTNFSMAVYIDDAGRFWPRHIGVQMGTVVTFQLTGFQSAAVESVNAVNRSWASARLNQLADPAAGIKPTFSIRFEEGGASSHHGSSAAVDLVIRTAGEVINFTNPMADADAGAGASGSVLVRPLRCETLVDCTSCLLYDPCIWCSSTASCFTRNATTNLPVDTGIVVHSNPDSFGPGGFANREYHLLKYYDPPTSISGLEWYPWPRQRSIPRIAKDWEVPGMRVEPGYFFPVSSDSCPSFADRALGPKGVTAVHIRGDLERGVRDVRAP